MKKIHDILNQLIATKNPMIVRPATDEDISLCNQDLSDCEPNISLPDGYVQFLKMLNGFAWNGIEFFSTDQVTNTETDYTLLDIVSANEDFQEYYEGFTYMVHLGQANDDVYVYNTKNGRYEIRSIVSRKVMEDFDSFEAMFVGVVAPRI
jgi:hypothetical protein